MKTCIAYRNNMYFENQILLSVDFSLIDMYLYIQIMKQYFKRCYFAYHFVCIKKSSKIIDANVRIIISKNKKYYKL